jgi:lipoprotein-releasing system permease protein
VTAAAPFIHNEVMLVSPSRAAGAVLRGIFPEQEGRVTDVGKSVKIGKMERLNQGMEIEGKTLPGIVLGQELARRLGVFLGDTVNIVSPLGSEGGPGMIPRFKRFAVVGIFDSGMYEYDSSLAYISIPQAQAFFEMGDQVSAIQVRVEDIFATGEISERIESELGPTYWARDWMEMNRNLFSALNLEKIVMFIILVLIVLVAAFNIIGTLTMIVMEKGREISILKAMGATRRGIMRIFMIDGLIIGIVGTVLGAPLGWAVSLAIEKFYTLPADVYYLSHVPVKLEPLDFILVIGSAIGISFLATLYPSWQAAKLDPAEGLRYE